MNKLEIVNTYMNDENYWAPLYMDDDDTEDQEDNTSASANGANEKRRALIKTLIRARLARNQHIYGQEYKTASIVVDSGATSHFVQSTDDLPYSGQSQKLVQLPDGS